MTDHRYIDIVPLEKAGWFLTRQTKNEKAIACVETKPLRCVPDVKLPEKLVAQITAPIEKVFTYPPTFRDTDENGKPICRRCGARLGKAKTAFCPSCGGQFVEDTDAE